MSDLMRQLPQYQSHKKVWALKIAKIVHNISPDPDIDGTVYLIPENDLYGPITLPRDYVVKHQPDVGGYYVQFADGYKAFADADAFEEGYTQIKHQKIPVVDSYTAADATAESIADAMVTLDQMPPSREASLVQTKLEEAMMWLNCARPKRGLTPNPFGDI
jgi:hypothetical protein